MSNVPQKPGRWFCAIPMAYDENAGFWERDAALVCLGFRKLGMDSKFIALGQPSQCEDPPLILSTLEQMMDPNWWRQWNLEGVLLYAWALPRYEPIARAIKTAKLKLNLVLDTDGIVNPHIWPRRYLQEKYYAERDRAKWFPAGWALLKTWVASFRMRHAGMLRHLEHGDLFTLPSPLAQQRYRRFLLAVGRPDLASRLRFVPYAVTPDMVGNPSVRKQPLIIAVGRWQAFQKGTPALARVLERVLSEQPAFSARVIGVGEDRVRELMRPLDDAVKSRIQIPGRVSHTQLPGHYQQARILLCTSYLESFHIASGEALCCGCSVVGDVRISSMPYLCSASSGTLSCDLSVDNLSDALRAEIDAWERGDRDPMQISNTWTQRLHPEKVAARFLSLF
jgi:glycosyltransferase involved in cell wall biosynthesis